MITAIFSPQSTDDLTDSVKKLIGVRTRFRYGWQIEPPYKFNGQIAWIPVDLPLLGWVPTEDLVRIEPTGFVAEAITDVHIYDHVLSPAEVWGLYNSNAD